jgi:hypothetical protein
MPPGKSSSAKRFARDLLGSVASDLQKSDLLTPALEKKVKAIEDRLDDAYTLLRALVGLEVVCIALVFGLYW